MLARLGVRWRLLFAFLGISAFAVLSAVAGAYAFREVAYVLERITEQRVPSALAALDLSRQADRIVAAAPALLTADSQAQHREVSTTIAGEVGRLETLLAQVRGSAVDSAALAAIEPAVAGLRRNLDALDDLVARRLEVSARKDAFIHRLSDATVAAQRLVAPGIVVMDSTIAALRRQIKSDESPGTNAPPIGRFAQAIAENVPMQKAQREFAAINDGLLKASTAASPADLPLIAIPLNRSLAALRDTTRDLASRLQPRFEQLTGDFAQLVEGPDSILEARAIELGLITKAEGLLAENAALSKRLTGAVDGLVTTAGRDIREAGDEALTAQRVGRGVLVGVVVVSLLSSVLIVWLYVDRSLVARLTALSNSMLAIAGGNLRAPLPSGGNDEISRMAQALTVFRDTAIEVEEKSLREVAVARQRLVDAIESISEGFALYDADDRLILCNSRYHDILYPGAAVAMVPGTTFEEVIRRAVELGLIHDATGGEEAWIVERMARHRNPVGPIIEHRSADRWIQASERKIAGGGSVAVYTDITELKRHEAQLELARDQAMKATQAKSGFLANMSHELRTPLNAVLGYAELLLDGIYGELSDKARGVLERVQSNGKHLLGLINDVLDLSKIEAGQLALAIEDYAMQAVVHSVVSATESLANAKGLSLESSVPRDLPMGRGDERRLTQVLLNLVGNAIKFTNKGSIGIAVALSNGCFDLAVSDTGPGIAKADQARIFEEFQQIDSSSTRQKGGTGLGLAISKRIVEMHGGAITVDSEPGIGSTFHVVIPVRVEQAKEVA
jgi:adenylate cyclase